MVINYQLAKEVFGIVPWLVDAKSFPILSSVLKNSQSGITLEIPEEKYNAVSFFKYADSAKTITRPYGTWYNPGELDNDEVFEAVAIVNINGPITKSGGMSSYGMDYVSNLMLKMNSDKRIVGFLIYGDSGGGSSSAVELMDDTIKEIRKTKPVYALIEKGGMACSAMYGIISGCNKIYSESGMNFVGSIGTMIQFEGRKANSEAPDGTKYVRVYATKSSKKNKDFEEALNHDNYDLLISELLDPVNENFLNRVQTNRPQLVGTDFDNGNDKFAKDAIGTFIDGIKSFSEVAEEVMQDYKTNYESIQEKEIKNNSKNNPKATNSMTKAELKAQFPGVYQEIYDSGVQAEKDRVGVWMSHNKADPEMVQKGIESGKEISPVEREQLLIKSYSKGKVEEIAQDAGANPAAASATSTTEEDKDKAEVDNFYKDILKA